MKSSLRTVLLFCFLCVARVSAEESLLIRSPDQLDRLFGPIALYPDALIALILPASTVPSDVVLASRFLNEQGKAATTENEPWDDSVRALAHYPDVIKWMDQNLAWTKQAGEAFLSQPADVMNTIQRLRAKARAAGTLKDTPQQQIVLEGETIRIIPAQTDVIYVPVYDPEVVYVYRSGYYSDPFLTFGVGWATGFWLGYDLDWGHRRIWTVDRHDRERYWHERSDWRRPNFPDRPEHNGGTYHQQPWRPPANYPRSPSQTNSHSRPVHPSPNPDVTGPVSRSPESDPRRNGPDRVPGDPNRKQDRDNRGGPSTHRPDKDSTSTNRSGTPTQSDRVSGGTTQPVPNQPSPPSSAPQNHRDHPDRVPQPRLPQDNSGNTRMTHDRSPTSVTPMPRPVPDAPAPRVQPPAPVRDQPTRSEPPAPVRDQSARSERSAPPAKVDAENRADRVPRERD